MADPDCVRERWLELQESAAVDAVRKRCQAAAVEERPVSFSWWAHCPRPFPRELAGEDPRRGGRRGDAQLGVDAVGRPVYQRYRGSPCASGRTEGRGSHALGLRERPSGLGDRGVRAWGAPQGGGPERGPHWRAKVHAFAYDAAGELATITTHLSKRELAPAGDAEAAHADALAGMDAGDIHFLGTPEDIRTGRWDQISVYPNSC